MRIFIVSSKHLYHKVDQIKIELENLGHVITLPNSYDDPLAEEKARAKSINLSRFIQKKLDDEIEAQGWRDE